MNGRIEHEMQERERIERILKDQPDYLKRYYYSIAPGKTTKTCIYYLEIIQGFLSWANKDVGDIQDIDVGGYLVEKSARKKNGRNVSTSPDYQRIIYAALNSFFGYMQKAGNIKINPVSLVSKTNKKARINKKFLSENDLIKILESSRKGAGTEKAREYQSDWRLRDELIVTMLILTGMRETALTEINIDDIDFKKKSLVIMDKGEKFHECDIRSAIDLINRWLKKREELLNVEGAEETNALFISNARKRITPLAVSNIVKKYSLDAIGYAITPHKIRAAVCSILLNTTGNAEFVRKAIGHSSITSTMRYFVTENKEQEQAARIISKTIKIGGNNQ